MAAAASDAVAGASDTAAAAADQAAQAAQDAVADASDVASALVEDAAAAANAAVDAARTASEAAASNLAAAAAELGAAASPAPIDWEATAGNVPDARFAGLKVLVAGATGGVGRCVVAALRAKGAPLVRALVRDTQRAASLLPTASAGSSSGSTFEVVRGDVYQWATLAPAFRGVNALVICTAANDKSDPLGPFKVDYQGTKNLLAAARKAGVHRVVLVTTISADDDVLNPLNLAWGIVWWKKRAEEEVQRSGLPHTIVRPGGLLNRLRPGQVEGQVVMEGPGAFGFPPLKRSGSILRSQVADVCVEALVSPAAVDKVVEVVAEPSAPARTLQQLFESVAV